MKRAFVLSRPHDLPIAQRCAVRLAGQGWLANILLDPREWQEWPQGAIGANYWTGGRGMFGNDCAIAIADAILANSEPGDWVAKFDCDTRVNDGIAEWFSTPLQRAKIFQLGGKPWGGCWSASREQVKLARDFIAAEPPCKCPESGLFVKAFRRHGGIAPCIYPCEKWKPFGAFPTSAGCVTLPTICRLPNRLNSGLALFDFRED